MEVTHQIKKRVILGLNGSGKTHFAKHEILDKEPRHLVIDPNHEYGGYTRYLPKHTQNETLAKEELEIVIRRIINKSAPMAEEKRKVKNPLKLVLVDEADLYIPAKKNIPYQVRKLIVECRHRNLDLTWIGRRPTDLNAYVMDLSDELIIFCQTGVNSIQRLNSLAKGLGDAAAALDFNRHEYLIVDRARHYEVITPPS